MKYAMIEDDGANARTFQVVRLNDGARLSPAGYVVGSYDSVQSGLSVEDARAFLCRCIIAGSPTPACELMDAVRDGNVAERVALAYLNRDLKRRYTSLADAESDEIEFMRRYDI